jgi:DNA polymerase III delta prime subunit
MNLLDTIKYGISNSYILNTADLSIGMKDVTDFMKQINCVKDVFCETCFSCSRINRSEHPDFIVLPNEENFNSCGSIKIDDIRLLQKEAILNPVDSKYRVIAINYADRMTEQAQNSLLKILEECPSKTIIFLITDNIFSLLSTIRSRCRQINYSFKKNITTDFIKNMGILKDSSNNIATFFNKCKEISSSKDKSMLLDFIDFAIILMRDILSYSSGGNFISNGIDDIIKTIKISNIPEKIDQLNNYRFLVKERNINKDIVAVVVMATILDYK